MSDPFKIEGPAQIGLSGGRSSGFMMKRIRDAHGGTLPDDVYVTFQNTGKEREETLAFVDRMDREWGLNVQWIEWCGVYGTGLQWKLVDFESASRDSEPFDMFLKYYDDFRRIEKNEPPILPNVVNRMCSDRMKIKASIWFMRDLKGLSEWDAVLGMRADEPRRYASAMSANEKGLNRYETLMPMYAAGVTKQDVGEFWASHSFDLGIDSDLGNCDGCFLKHPNKLLRTFRADPERADWWIAQEERTGQKFIKNGMNYREMKWVAMQMNKQLPLIDTGDEAETAMADCFCGD